MVEFISNLVGNDIIATLIVSILPMIELKGGIVFARGAGLGFFASFGLAYIGSTIAFVLVYFLLKPVLKLMKKIKWFNKLACKVEGYFADKAEDIVEKQNKKYGDSKHKSKMSETLLKQLGVFIFVAIPLPLTGVWAGTAIAVFLNLRFKDTILPIALGNLVAGLIISGLSALFIAVWDIKVLDYVLYALLGLAVILTVIVVIKLVKQKPKARQDSQSATVEEIKEEE